MKVENEQKGERRAAVRSDGFAVEEPHHETQRERDEQIAEMEQRSRHQTHAAELHVAR